MAYGIVNIGTKPVSEEQQNPDDKYLTIESAQQFYLKKDDAENKYLDKETAQSTYLDKETAGKTYLDKETANKTFLNSEEAASTYLNKETAGNTYLDKETAGNTYLKKTGGKLEGSLDANQNDITNVKDPTNDGDAVNLKYMQTFVEKSVSDSVSKDNLGIYVQNTQPENAVEKDIWINTDDKSINVYENEGWKAMSSVSELEKSFVSYITEMSISELGKTLARKNIGAGRAEEKVVYSDGVTNLNMEDNKYYFIHNATSINFICDADKTAECRGWITFATRGTVDYESGVFDCVDDPDDIVNAENNSKWEFSLSNGCLILALRTKS